MAANRAMPWTYRELEARSNRLPHSASQTLAQAQAARPLCCFQGEHIRYLSLAGAGERSMLY